MRIIFESVKLSKLSRACRYHSLQKLARFFKHSVYRSVQARIWNIKLQWWVQKWLVRGCQIMGIHICWKPVLTVCI